MDLYHKRPTVADIRALKGKRQLTMLYVETPDEAAAAAAAGIDMLSIIDPAWTEEMRKAAGNCFVQVGLLYGQLVTLEDYQRAAHRAMQAGGDCVYCASSMGTIKALADDGIPVVSHVGLIPSKSTWTGGFKAVGKTAESAMQVLDHVRQLIASRFKYRNAQTLFYSAWGLARMLTRNTYSPKTYWGALRAISRATQRRTAILPANSTACSKNALPRSASSRPMSMGLPIQQQTIP